MKTTNQSSSRLLFLFTLILFLAALTTAEAQPGKPEKMTRLVSGLLSITFDPQDGLPIRYDLTGEKETFMGKEEGQSIQIAVKRKSGKPDTSVYQGITKTGNGEIYIPDTSVSIIKPRLIKIEFSNNQADSRYVGYLDHVKAVSFTISYLIKDQTVFVTMADVLEKKGYELIEIQTNSLVSISQASGKEWFAHGDGGGYFAELAVTTPCVLKDGWSKDFPYFPNFSYLPLVLMGNGQLNVGMEVQGYLSNTQIKVSGLGGQKAATMGVKSYFRVKGAGMTSLLVEQNEICRIDFTGDYDKNHQVDWLDAAKAMRDRMPLIPTHYYDDRMVWIISGQPGRAENATITFPGIERVIKKISRLTDGVPQAVYISGWTEGGHDTGYPNITRLNELMGGLAGFRQLQEKAAGYDANISFDDNYDDQFNNEYSSGHFDEKYIARNPDGSLMQQRAWNGVDTSHITGMAKYMKDGGPGMERVRYTCQAYNLKQTELVDAITWWSIRNDWDPLNPASAVKNLRDGKFRLISEYEKYGVYIISELLRYPFVGKLALVVDGPDGGGWNGFGGTQIPLQRLVYSRSIIYGPGGGDGVARDPRLTLMHNSRRGPWISESTPMDDVTNYYYLNFLPWTKLHALDILSFERVNQTIHMKLANNSSVTINYTNPDGFSAIYQGVQIMEGNSITCPLDEHRIAFYSKTARTLSYPVPAGRDSEQFRASVLQEDTVESHPFTIVNGKIEVSVSACKPVILYY